MATQVKKYTSRPRSRTHAIARTKLAAAKLKIKSQVRAARRSTGLRASANKKVVTEHKASSSRARTAKSRLVTARDRRYRRVVRANTAREVLNASAAKAGSAIGKTTQKAGKAANQAAAKGGQKLKSFFCSLQMAERVFLGLVLASVISVGSGVAIGISYDPQKDTEAAIESLAKEFYTAEIYPNLAKVQADNPEELVSRYAQTGLPIVKLRKMLYYDDDTMAYSARINNQYYICDTNNTTVKFYPVEPYGAQDVEIKVKYSCSER